MPLPAAVASALRNLDATVMQARRGKEGELRIQPSAHERLDSDWKAVVPALQTFLETAVGQTALQNFAISRDQTEVSVKLKDNSARGSTYLILSRRHPTDVRASEDCVWLGAIGEAPVAYTDAIEAMRFLIRRIAT
jgi:hypothetical protein